MVKQSNSELYLDSCIHEDHFVCGKQLKPFTLKLYIRLELVESPIVTSKRELSWEDLEQAVALCSYQGSEPMDAIKFKRFGFFKRLSYKLWHLHNHYRRDIQKEYDSFMDYVQDYCVLPEMEAKGNDWQLSELEQQLVDEGKVMPPPPEIKDNPFPWYLLHQMMLVKKTGWTPEYIENLPLSKIIWWNEGLNYLEFGDTRIKGDNFNAVMEIAIKERADRERAQSLTLS